MVDATYLDNGRVQVINNDDVSFDTARPSIALFPDSSRIIKTGFSINFPSLVQWKAYWYFNNGLGVTSCALWSTLIWQEWGPDEGNHNEVYYSPAPQNSIPGPTTRNLPRIFLGSVPADANYLDIRVKLNRLQAPPAFIQVEPPIVFFPEGEWINLPGGSCPCEYFDPMIRHFDIVRIGNDIYLERYQSVRNSGLASTVSPAGGPQEDLSANQSGWNSRTYGGDLSDTTEYNNNSQAIPMSNTELSVVIQQKLGGTSQKRPNQGDRCAGPYPDLASTYVGDIMITPGRYRAA